MTSVEYAAIIGIICTFIFGIISIIYFNRSYRLMHAIDVKRWSEISDHYPQIKYLKESKWKM